jgi:hypothetical protein
VRRSVRTAVPSGLLRLDGISARGPLRRGRLARPDRHGGGPPWIALVIEGPMRIGIMLRHYEQHHGGVKVYTENLAVRHLAMMCPRIVSTNVDV